MASGEISPLSRDANFVSAFDRLCSAARYGQNIDQYTEDPASEPLRDAARAATYLMVDFVNGRVDGLREVDEILSDIKGVKDEFKALDAENKLVKSTIYVAAAAEILVNEIARRVKAGLACGADVQQLVAAHKLDYPIRGAGRRTGASERPPVKILLPAPAAR